MIKKILLVGGGGREHAFAQALCDHAVVYAIMGHANPGMIDCVEQSGGAYVVDDANDPQKVLKFAQKYPIDIAFVSADTPLSKGVVDILLSHNIAAVGGTQAATQIEWDKIYSIEMMQEVCPEFTPFYRVVSDTQTLHQAIQEFQQKKMQVVVKPQGLTGGKGVKVMPEHLSDYSEALSYASELLSANMGEQVLLVERLQGIEFTIMGLTDGVNLVLCPATYDYPFRLENDQGPGTGGMGCFSDSGHKLPFMSEQHWQDCQSIMQGIIEQMRQNQLDFKGVLNGGFFLTAKGIRFMEFNGRFGDPEAINIMGILQSPLADVITDMWEQRLSDNQVHFSAKASVVKYLVAKEYPNKSPEALNFTLDEAGLAQLGVRIIYSSCVRDGVSYQTLKSSRVVALMALADTVSEAAQTLNQAIERCVSGALEYRSDIGSVENLKKIQSQI